MPASNLLNMKTSPLIKKGLTVAALIVGINGLVFSPVAQADPSATATTSVTNITSGEAFAGEIPSTADNLLSTATLSSPNNWNSFTSTYQSTPFVPTGDANTSGSYTTLTDGQGYNYNDAGSLVAMASNGSDDYTTITYTLTPVPGGYTLTSIDVFTGWKDGGRINPTFDISYSTDGIHFVNLTGADIDFNAGGYGNNAAAVQLDVTGLTGVTALQFQFPNQQNDYVGYAELAAVGSPSAVPEPSDWGILMGGIGCFVVLKRIRANLAKKSAPAAI